MAIPHKNMKIIPTTWWVYKETAYKKLSTIAANIGVMDHTAEAIPGFKPDMWDVLKVSETAKKMEVWTTAPYIIQQATFHLKYPFLESIRKSLVLFPQ
jgi:hypothetical protein